MAVDTESQRVFQRWGVYVAVRVYVRANVCVYVCTPRCTSAYIYNGLLNLSLLFLTKQTPPPTFVVRPIVRSQAQPFWGIFKFREAFKELFCVAYRLFHRMWVDKQGRTADVGKILASVEKAIFGMLGKNPSSYDEFINMAMVNGHLEF